MPRSPARLALIGTVALVAAFAEPAAAQSAQGRTGTLVVLNKGAATATFVDVASGETVATLPTGQGPHELAMTGDGRWAVSTDYAGGNSLTVFDVAGARVAGTVDLAAHPRPHGAFFLPGDSILAVTSEASRSVVLVQPFRGEILGTVGTGAEGSHMVAVTGMDLYSPPRSEPLTRPVMCRTAPMVMNNSPLNRMSLKAWATAPFMERAVPMPMPTTINPTWLIRL